MKISSKCLQIRQMIYVPHSELNTFTLKVKEDMFGHHLHTEIQLVGGCKQATITAVDPHL